MKIKRLVEEVIELNLLPCPFCGCEVIGIGWSSSGKCAHCVSCFAQGPAIPEPKGEEYIVELWNRRIK